MSSVEGNGGYSIVLQNKVLNHAFTLLTTFASPEGITLWILFTTQKVGELNHFRLKMIYDWRYPISLTGHIVYLNSHIKKESFNQAS